MRFDFDDAYDRNWNLSLPLLLLVQPSTRIDFSLYIGRVEVQFINIRTLKEDHIWILRELLAVTLMKYQSTIASVIIMKVIARRLKIVTLVNLVGWLSTTSLLRSLVLNLKGWEMSLNSREYAILPFCGVLVCRTYLELVKNTFLLDLSYFLF